MSFYRLALYQSRYVLQQNVVVKGLLHHLYYKHSAENSMTKEDADINYAELGKIIQLQKVTVHAYNPYYLQLQFFSVSD